MAVTQYIGARYVPIFAEPVEWSGTKSYEPLTIVTHEGASYTSRQFVPVGISLDDGRYWVLTGNYNAQVESYREYVDRVADTLPLSEFDGTTVYQELQNTYQTTLDNIVYVTPQMFGAVGDGTTDDTQAFREALQSDKPLFIPKATYLVDVAKPSKLDRTKPIRVPSNKHIIGDFPTLKVKPNSSPWYAVFLLSRVHDVYISGINFLGDRDEHEFTEGSPHEWGFGVHIIGSKNVVVANCTFKDTTGDGIEIGKLDGNDETPENVILYNLTIDNVRRNGISVTNGYNITVENCVISNINGTAPQSGIDLEPNSIANDLIRNIKINKCKFYNTVSYAITVWLAENVFIDGNYIQNCGEMIRMCSGTNEANDKNIIVTNNIFENETVKVFAIGKDNIISNNKFYNARIALTMPHVLDIGQSVFSNNTVYGIFVYMTTWSATAIEANGSIISGNTFIADCSAGNQVFRFGTGSTASIKNLIVTDNSFYFVNMDSLPVHTGRECVEINAIMHMNRNTFYNLPYYLLVTARSTAQLIGNTFINCGHKSNKIIETNAPNLILKDNVFDSVPNNVLNIVNTGNRVFESMNHTTATVPLVRATDGTNLISGPVLHSMSTQDIAQINNTKIVSGSPATITLDPNATYLIYVYYGNTYYEFHASTGGSTGYVHKLPYDSSTNISLSFNGLELTVTGETAQNVMVVRLR